MFFGFNTPPLFKGDKLKKITLYYGPTFFRSHFTHTITTEATITQFSFLRISTPPLVRLFIFISRLRSHTAAFRFSLTV